MRIGIDIGGTFTDFVFFDERTGTLSRDKILSTPQDPAQSVLSGLGDRDLAEAVIIHGSTVATNAVLEGKGARTAFVTTRGFKDILTIGRQTRTHLYDFWSDRPEPLVPPEWCFELDERVDYQGQVLVPLAESEIEALVAALRAERIESVAVSFLFSFLHPDHEQTVARLLREAGFFVSTSSEVLPEFREYERTSTTVINAYVSPVLDRYLGRLADRLGAADFRIMQSNGGTMRADLARQQGVRSILSGPAGGVVGALHVARLAGFEQIMTFDMGGTSTDVALCQGEIRVTTEADIRGLPIRIPVIDIHTVGSGGGSIARVDAGGALRVGPESAGALPGPVCYGRGGTAPTVTDANLVLGRMASDYFLGGRMALDTGAAHEALTDLGRQLGLTPHGALDLAQTAALGIVEIANAHMARALRVISVERGYDPSDFVLLSFGGAGGMHACDLARHLGIRRVLIPTLASTLSAFGMLAAEVVKDYVQTVMLPGETPVAVLEERLRPLAERGMREVAAEGVAPEQITLWRELDMRQVGQSYELTIPLTPDFRAEFHRRHEQAYGYSDPTAPLEIVNVRLRAVGAVQPPQLQQAEVGPPDPHEALDTVRPVVLRAGPDARGVTLADVPFYLGERLRPGHAIAGPAVIVQKDTTIFLAHGDRATVDGYYNLIVEVG